MGEEILQSDHWDEQYQEEELPWETGRVASELRRVLTEQRIPPGQALEIGCGTGSSAIWLASQGFTVTATDLSPVAIRRAKRRARAAGITVNFQVADITDPASITGCFDFFFDGGCYHAVRLANGPGYLLSLQKLTHPGSLGLVLLGNANEPEDEAGPPVLEEEEVREEWGQGFDILQLRQFRFDAGHPQDKLYLGWSCLVRRKS